MLKVGLFFGSFNPIHIGHLILANHFAEYSGLDEVWLVVTPQNPFKKKQSLLGNNHRLELVFRATEEYPKLKPSAIEFDLPIPNYTSVTLAHLEEKYPSKTFCLLLGEDNIRSFHKWKNYNHIIENYTLYVYPRGEEKNSQKKFEDHHNIKRITAPKIELSSSQIRKAIKEGKNIRPLMPPESWKYLDEMNFYKR